MPARQRLIEEMGSLMQAKGYFGAGINEVLQRANVPKGSLYHHFPKGKEELVAAALEFEAQQKVLEFKQAMKGKKTAERGLAAVINIFIRDLEDSNHKVGCPLANVAMDATAENEVLRKTCATLYDFWTDALESYLTYKEVERPRHKAEQFLVMLEGAILLGKVHKSTQHLKHVKAGLEQLIRS